MYYNNSLFSVPEIRNFQGDNHKWNLILNTLAWTSLMVVNCTFSLSAKDVLKDAEGPARSCTTFQTQYFSAILYQEETDEKSDKTVTVSTRL